MCEIDHFVELMFFDMHAINVIRPYSKYTVGVMIMCGGSPLIDFFGLCYFRYCLFRVGEIHRGVEIITLVLPSLDFFRGYMLGDLIV